MSLKLMFSNGSPFARRVRIVLLEKELAFIPDVYDGMRSIEAIQPDNPLLQVPVLHHDGRRLFGTALICDYLYATFPHTPAQPVPLAPTLTRPAQHWEDRLTLNAIESLTDTIVNLRLLTADGPLQATYLGRQRQRLETTLAWLETRVTPTGFWPGMFSVMDIGLLAAVRFAETRGVIEATDGRYVRIAAMIDHWSTRASVMATLPNTLPVRPQAPTPVRPTPPSPIA